MEKVTLYVRKVLALLLSFSVFPLAYYFDLPRTSFWVIVLFSLAFLLLAYINFRLTEEKPRFLFGLNQADAFLNKKGGFWTLFKWIVVLLGLLYDLLVWVLWGVFLIFMLFVDLLMLVKFLVYWLVYALIWLVRQVFPPFVFIFKMVYHYLIKWVWWIYQLTVRNMRLAVNRNFYIIALWGTIPALFIVFLFYLIGQVVNIEALIAVSIVFALIPLVWSFGEISALRYEERCKEEYTSVKHSFGNGFVAVKAILFYLLLIIVLLLAEIVLNMAGWIPAVSMSFIGISLNLSMAVSVVLVLLAILIAFAGAILPTHIIYAPDHENDIRSSARLLSTIFRRIPRYSIAHVFSGFFGSLLLIIPLVLMFLAFNLTNVVKEEVLDIQISRLESKKRTMAPSEAYKTDLRIDRIELYKGLPEGAPESFRDLVLNSGRVADLKQEITDKNELLLTTAAQQRNALSMLRDSIKAEQALPDSLRRPGLEGNLLAEEEKMSAVFQAENIAVEEELEFMNVDLKTKRLDKIQMPILYVLMGVFMAIFGGLVLAVFIAYIANVYYELYNFREDGKLTVWSKTLLDLREKDSNQPLLGFSILFFVALLTILGILGHLPFL